MKTEEELLTALQTAMNNIIRADSFEAVRFYQGQINILEWYFAKPEDVDDAFKGEPVKEKKDE